MAESDVFRLTVVGRTTFFTDLVNAFTFIQVGDTGGSEGDQCEDLIDAWQTLAEAAYQATFSGNNEILQYRAERIVGEAQVFEKSLAIDGALTGDALPPQIAALIIWKTGLPGRRNQGRTYLWAANEASQVNGNWVSGYFDALNTFGDAISEIFSDALVGTRFRHCVHSAKFDTTHIVTSQSNIGAARTQRRRTVGFGS